MYKKRLFLILITNLLLSLSIVLYQSQPVKAVENSLTIKYYVPFTFKSDVYENTNGAVFAGRTIKVNFSNGGESPSSVVAYLSKEGFWQQLTVERFSKNYLITTLPLEILTGEYTLNVIISSFLGNQSYRTPINIEGYTQEELNELARSHGDGGGAAVEPLDDSPGVRLDCGGCYNNAVIATHPQDSQNILVVGYLNQRTDIEQSKDVFRVSHDGGQHWLSGSHPDGNFSYYNYPDALGITNPNPNRPEEANSFLISGQILDQVIGTLDNPKFGGGLFKGFVGQSEFPGTIFQAADVNQTATAEFIRLAYHPQAIPENKPKIYITAGTFDSQQNSTNSLFISKDQGQNFTKKPIDPHFDLNPDHDPDIWTVRSVDTSPDGTLRAAVLSRFDLTQDDPTKPNKAKFYLLRFDSNDDLRTLTTDKQGNTSGIEMQQGGYPDIRIPFARLAYATTGFLSKIAWNVWVGPDIAVNKIQGHKHFGRVYVVWAEPSEVIYRPLPSQFQQTNYGYNYDVYLAFSDDDGANWSTKQKVNDDPECTVSPTPENPTPPNPCPDQVFPSTALDKDGNLHITFLDRREDPAAAKYDVYYTFVRDSPDKELEFSLNKRINQNHISINIGGIGFDPGVYLKMVSPTGHIVYPCKTVNNSPTDACVAGGGPQFLRGDSNNDRKVDISDAISTLGWLFLGKDEPRCLDAADANDDGKVDISDAIFELGFLFLGGKAIPPPNKDTGLGPDPTDDPLGCNL